MIQVAEGTLNEVADIFVRMRELAVQASTGTMSTTDRTALNTEFQALLAEADRLGENTEFNGINIGGSTAGAVALQVGIHNGPDYKITVTMIDVTSLSPTGNISTAAGAATAISTVDVSILGLSAGRAKLGASHNRLESTVGMLENARNNMSAAESRIRDADIATESAELARHTILAQAGAAALASANQIPALALTLLGG